MEITLKTVRIGSQTWFAESVESNFLHRYLPTILFLLIALPLFSQGESYSKLKTDFHIGIRLGGHISMLKYEGGGPHSYQVSLDDVQPFKPGFNIGFFPDFKRKGHFSVQPELSYYYASREGVMSEFIWTTVAPYRHLTKTPVTLSSALRLAALGKFSSGSKQILNLMLGPDIRIPLMSSSGKIASGLMAGLRFDFPDKNNNYLCLELRAGADISDMLDNNNLVCRERFAGLSVAYLMH